MLSQGRKTRKTPDFEAIEDVQNLPDPSDADAVPRSTGVTVLCSPGLGGIGRGVLNMTSF